MCNYGCLIKLDPAKWGLSMSTQVLPYEFDAEQYNRLGSIEDADRWVRADSQLDEFLENAGRILFEYGAHSVYGVGLLHRHHWCAPGEHFRQEERKDLDETVLVTRPAAGSPNLEVEVPWLWSYNKGNFHPLEYTSDNSAGLLYERTKLTPRAFFDEMSDFMGGSPIGHLLGLAILDRDLHKTMSDDEMFLECSYNLDKESVIYVRKRDDTSDSIITTWSFREVVDPVSGCVEPETGCKPRYGCKCDWVTEEDGRRVHQGHRPFKEGHDQIRGQHSPSWP
jgi:hypothetical protein